MKQWLRKKIITFLFGSREEEIRFLLSKAEKYKKKMIGVKEKERLMRGIVERGEYKTMSYRELALAIGDKHAQSGKYYLLKALKEGA